MPVIKVTDLAYLRVEVPSLADAKLFFADFGLITAAETADCLYMRGLDSERQSLIVREGGRKLAAIAFKTDSREDLDRVASAAGSEVTVRGEPGGGWQTALSDPEGNRVEIVYGIETVEPIIIERTVMNHGTDRFRRTGQLCRPPYGPSHVLRLGHVVITSQQPDTVGQWYRDMFGLLVSDEVTDDHGNVILSFNRLNRGEEYVDHHVFQTQPGPAGGVHHISFEVLDVDDLYVGSEHLALRGYRHMWGVGRHKQGSQIFDYWLDPFGTMYEHWTDTDMLNADAVPSRATVAESLGPWGPPLPEGFITQVS